MVSMCQMCIRDSIRAENEDDDGDDPDSDRRPEREPMFEADPGR